MRVALAARVEKSKYPIRGIFVVCCASASTPQASSTIATKIVRRFVMGYLITRSAFISVRFCASPNNLGRTRQDIGVNHHADLRRRLKVDYELKFHRLLHRKVGRFGSL